MTEQELLQIIIWEKEMTSKEIASIAINAIEDKKGEDIKIIDISNVSVLADYFIIANGNSVNQVQAIADNVDEALSKQDIHPKQVEGYQNANWVLMDFGDVIIHVFDKDNRLFYNLERIWKDGKTVTKEDIL